MPRKGAVPKRQILPDPRFNSKVLARFINKVMLAGKKSTAERITYGALDVVGEKLGRDPMDVFTQALGNAMPLVEVRPRRCHVSGSDGSASRPPSGDGDALADSVRP
jgi:small subunit ribosomal protein S7